MFFINLIVGFGCLVALQDIQLLGQNVALAQASQEIKYQFYRDELKTWYEARNFCSSKNMKLAEILSYEQQQHLRQYIRNHNLLPKDSTSGYWLGGRLTGRTWFWDATGLNPSTDTRYMFGWQFGRPQTEWKNGAAVLGVIGAAGMFLMEKYRQEKMRNNMAKDLARLEKEMSKLKFDLQQLQSQGNNDKHARPKRVAKLNKSKKANSVLSATTDDYLSASNLDSSDLEFYDLSDEESTEANSATSLDLVLIDLDRKLDLENVEDIEQALQKLEDLCLENPANPDLLYRIGKAHHKLADRCEDKHLVQKTIAKGIEACSAALSVAPDHADVHKWYAVLIGSRSELVSLQERVNDGHLFKKHVDIAISINPNDASLHYMLGRFNYEVAGLKWYERKLAAALFGEPPNATYEEACSHFLEAERLATFDWKENRWMIAKCKIAMDEYAEAVEWLEKANESRSTSADEKIDSEINELLQKYGTYR